MLTLSDVSTRVNLSRRTIMRRVEQHRFPVPLIHKGRVILWREDDIAKYQQRRRRGDDPDDGTPRPTRRKRPARKRVGAAARAPGRKPAE